MPNLFNDLKAAEARVSELESELSAANALTSEIDRELAEFKASSKAEADKLVQEIADLRCELGKAAEAMKAEAESHAITSGKLDLAKRALADPSFAQAAYEGLGMATPEGGTPLNEEPLTRESALAEYSKISDPKAQKAYRVANWKILGIAEEK